MSDKFVTADAHELITADDFINAARSPPLQPAQINYRSTETPPPFVDIVDIRSIEDLEATEGEGEGPRARSPNLAKGPDYPEIALKASKELLPLFPDPTWEDRRPKVTSAEQQQMIYDTAHDSRLSAESRMLSTATFKASQKLNVVIAEDGGSTTSTSTTACVLGVPKSQMALLVQGRPSPALHYVPGVDTSAGLTYHNNQKPLNVKPPPRLPLPSIRTKSSETGSDWTQSSESIKATSPVLAKFTITPGHLGSDHQLPRMQTSPASASAGYNPPSRQTLPSLETALSAISTQSEPTYSSRSPHHLTRPSSGQLPTFGPSPPAYSQPSPGSAISPPRLSSNPSFWRTNSRETSNSTSSDHASIPPSAGISTPASSAPGLSPENSVHTPATGAHDTEARQSNDYVPYDTDMRSQPSECEYQFSGIYNGGSFRCTEPGCNAPPFQTQYLLNSHANVHSTQRPHFCPVHGCPRGQGGQGFKRKNEMIRHGLVHQSPGYVCPFCPDQQHKYPRPDNLQRHVRVHHVDKNRDDPLLRDVLAQRPEGGNRGRRRRLGS